MSVLLVVAYVVIVFLMCLILFFTAKNIEFIYCAYIMRQPPLVASPEYMRQKVVQLIISRYQNAKNICELGTGFGGLARMIARKTKANVYALENMFFSAFVSKTSDYLFGCKNNHTICCNIFDYLETTDKHFDVAVAYLGPTVTPMIYKYKNKIDVLISLDFEISGLEPKYVIDIGCGYTWYKGIIYPHRLFIYEFK